MAELEHRACHLLEEAEAELEHHAFHRCVHRREAEGERSLAEVEQGRFRPALPTYNMNQNPSFCCQYFDQTHRNCSSSGNDCQKNELLKQHLE